MKPIKVLPVLITLLAGMGVLGCTSGRSNLALSDTVYIERVPSSNRSILGVQVYAEDHQLVINGRVKRRNASFVNGEGHIDIAVVGPEGDILEQASTKYVPRIIPNRKMRGMRGSYFEVRLPDIPPTGSTVRIAYHRTAIPADRTLDCGKNAATLR
ncbi:MAG: hypothetical protein JRJ02_09515 [Deltaproteobacteria bacterium]|nr:hypothetical protein [Deltaproteobacteria bacterium]